jgi:hypothetical protein
LVDQMWTGRATLIRIIEHGKVAEVIEVAARRDHVTVWQGNRTLAVMDRDAFGAWLLTGTGEYAVDDLVWTLDARGLALTVDGVTRYELRAEMATWLAAVM